MSRTDKHRPYWVKVNDQGIEHHDHSQLGEEIWYSRAMKDVNGELVREIVPTYVHARDYLRSRERSGGDLYWMLNTARECDENGRRVYFFGHNSLVSQRKHHLIHAEAMQAVMQGDPTRLIESGTYSRAKMERYLAYTIPDHCTIDMMHDSYGQPSSGRGYNPCYKEADWATDRSTYACSCNWCNPGVDYGSLRRTKRESMQKAVRTYNSGDENWYDCLDKDDITPSRKTYRAW